MLLGSGEHYGWERPRPARVVRVLDGEAAEAEFAWVRAESGPGHDAVDVMVRPRFGEPRWRTPAPGERVQVAAWSLDADQVSELENEAAPTRWSPPQELPSLWLWVEGEDG